VIRFGLLGPAAAWQRQRLERRGRRLAVTLDDEHRGAVAELGSTP
jgi:hypothetical protein